MEAKRKEKLELRAYRLGFEVGFHAHDEWTSWVWKEKKKIFNEARKGKFLEKVEAAYEKGKFDGFLRKKKIKESKTVEKRTEIGLISRPSFISKPAMTKVVKTVLLPKFLRFFR
ncbi:hypothetical protein [Candidatus Pyrohabitans sp.]